MWQLRKQLFHEEAIESEAVQCPVAGVYLSHCMERQCHLTKYGFLFRNFSQMFSAVVEMPELPPTDDCSGRNHRV